MAMLKRMRKELRAVLSCTRKVLQKSKKSSDRAGHRETNIGETPPPRPHPETHRPTGAPWGEELTSSIVATATSLTILPHEPPHSKTQDELQPETADDLTWVFNGEAEDDYTADPSKVVHASDGTKTCVGILPSYGFSQELQRVVREHRKLRKIERFIDKDLNALDKEVHDLDEDLERLERCIVDVQQGTSEDARGTLLDMRHNVSALQQKRAGYARSEDSLHRQMAAAYLAFRQDQDPLLAELEALLVACALLPPDPASEGEPCMSDCASTTIDSSEAMYPHTTDLDLLQSARCRSELISAVAGERSNGKQPVVVDDPKRKLLYNLQVQRATLAHAEEALDNRYLTFDQEADARDRGLAEGLDVETNTEAELRQCRDTQHLTRQIIEAEKAYDEAKAALLLAGIQPCGSDISSGFVDDVNDGYRLSLEMDMCRSVDSVRIAKWLSAIPKPDCNASQGDYGAEDTPVGEPEVDDWDAKSVGGSDRGSMVAVGSMKKRIEKWHAICATVSPHTGAGTVGC